MRVLIFAVSIVAFGASLLFILPEFRVFLRAQQSPLDHFIFPDDRLSSAPWSVEGVYLALQTCDAALTSGNAQFMPQEARSALAERCLDLVQDVLDEAPSVSAAHMVAAVSHLELRHWDAAILAALASELTGGDITWMAERRLQVHAIVLGEEEARLLHTDVRDAFEREVVRLAQNQTGVQQLSQVYRQHADLRDVIVDVIETLPEAQQGQFVATIRRGG